MDEKEFQKRVGESIRSARKKRKISQETVSGIEMSVRGYQDIENGRSNIKLKSVFLIAKQLGCHPREFFAFAFPHERKVMAAPKKKVPTRLSARKSD